MKFKQAGLSLVELMIAIALGLILMTGVIQVFLSSRVAFDTQQALSRIQETGRLAMEFLSRDIRMAGYMGCGSRTEGAIVIDSTGLTAGLHKNFAVGLEGLTSAPANLITTEPVDGDILVVRAADAQPLFVNNINSANSLSVNVSASGVSDGCNSGICTGAVVSASDCVDSRIFIVEQLAVAGNTLTLTDVPIPEGNFAEGAELVPVNTYVYFVAPSVGDETRSSLWQKINSNAALELLEGVEQMRLMYGEGDDYFDADDVGDWDRIDNVRVEIVVASIADNVLNEPQPYTFDGAVVEPDDRRLRQVFVNTIVARSRLQ